FGTLYRQRQGGSLTGGLLPVDFAANAASLGARSIRAKTLEELTRALEEARAQKGPTVVVVETALEARVGSYESWWDVPVAEVSETKSARDAYPKYAAGRAKERFLG
ncbi:MAG: thiamine pyrophosphate-dependent enzyme, partial [Candidatus Acidiferrales bacterium]